MVEIQRRSCESVDAAAAGASRSVVVVGVGGKELETKESISVVKKVIKVEDIGKVQSRATPIVPVSVSVENRLSARSAVSLVSVKSDHVEISVKNE